jgi:hypothetical protein
MNPNLRLLSLAMASLVFSTGCSTLALPAKTEAPPCRLTVELRDGSRVIGTSVESRLKFHSALLGDFKLDVPDIRSIECGATNSAKLTTIRGDVLTVWFVNPELGVDSGFGKVKLSVNSIRRASVFATGRAREGLVAEWLLTGDGQDSVGANHGTRIDPDRSGFLVVSNSPALVSMQQTRQLTFEAWIKPRSIPHEFPVLLSKGGNQPDGAYGGYEFVLNANGDNDLGFESGGHEVLTYHANGRWINRHLGEWIHVAFTIDDRTKTEKIYVNGQPTNDERQGGTGGDLNFDLPNDLYIGTPDPASNANRARFDGEMRDLMLYNRALTAQEICEDYEAGHSN